MDQLYQLLCVPKPPSLHISDLKTGNFTQFLDVSMKSSASIKNDHGLKTDATKEFAKLVSAKSNSPSNTARMVNDIFKSASGACHLDRERALIDWLQVCVSTAIEFCLDPEKAKNNGYTQKPAPNPKLPKQPAPSSAKKNKKQQKEEEEEYELETDVSWEEDDGERYDLIGSSDDDYVPSIDDGVVPSKPLPSRKSRKDSAPAKAPRKKKNQDQVVPPSPPKSSKDAVIPLIKEGAGPKALQKYFAELENIDPKFKSSSAPVLSGDYFARAFFFPSKDSFNAFLSVLHSATKTIDICVFAFTDDDVANALISAKKRGVAIKIITDNQQAAGKGADAKRLQESYGIPFKTDNTTGYMHNKFAIIDSATLINGSFNWSKGARFKNRENVLITNIPVCIKEFQCQFDALWAEF
ncbi:hypothetical protein BD408DRAFT_423472 [Parasitella parasitica]|nr:hypothetical protein BD408DRAFT_423472 [Parasitella parasitica]